MSAFRKEASCGTSPAEFEFRAEGLACVRGERRLFSNLSFRLGAGGLLKVAGPNGSGKTSLLRMVCGLHPPAAGTITLNGIPMRELAEEYNSSLASVGHLNAIKDELNPRENLSLASRLSGLDWRPETISAALGTFGLLRSAALPCRVLSQGQKRRVALARLALSQARPLWVLDEPFAALDVAGIEILRRLLEDHLTQGGAIVLTTHQDIPFRAPIAQSVELGT